MALQLIDADGVEALTMRKLAAALDANPMSLYHHVPNKDAVLRGVAHRVGSQFSAEERGASPGRTSCVNWPGNSVNCRTVTRN